MQESVIDPKNFIDNQNNTGCVEYQVASLTKRILYLTEHCKTFKKDNSAKKAVLALVNQRKRLLKYISRKSSDRYQSLIKKLDLRK